MFQVVDDLLDVTQSAEHTGKATGKDLPAGKLTYPGVHGTAASRQAVERLRCEAHAALEPLGRAGSDLRELCDYMAVRTR
jgi:farnesyl diphosphate synthase